MMNVIKISLVILFIIMLLSGCKTSSQSREASTQKKTEIIQTTTSAKTATTEKPVGSTNSNIILANGLAINLFRIERDDTVASVDSKWASVDLYFSFTKTNSDVVEFGFVPKIVDDRGNKYGVELGPYVTFQGWDIKSLPVGLTWVNRYYFSIPKTAPIDKIIIAIKDEKYANLDYPEKEQIVKEIKYSNFKETQPIIGNQTKKSVISMGEWISQGNNLKWSVKDIRKEIGKWYIGISGGWTYVNRWAVTIEVENLDYNERKIDLGLRIQTREGIVLDNGFSAGKKRDTAEWQSTKSYVGEKIPGKSKVEVFYYFPETYKGRIVIESDPIALLVLSDGKAYIIEIK